MTGLPKTEALPDTDAGAGHERVLTDLQAEMEALATILPGAAAAVAEMVPVQPADDESVEAGFDNLPV